MATAIADTLPTRAIDVRYVPLKVLQPHPLNPRQHFNEAFLEELATSLRTKGVLTPLLVRPSPADVETSKRVLRGQDAPQFQVLAGHQRLRAAKLAELLEVPVIIRDLDDDAALELMVIDNLQRADVHPLDEASGYESLMTRGHDVARIAERVGRSIKYVYDRVKLLQLVPELQNAFLEGRITAGHAILLARLSLSDQTRANTAPGALWESQRSLWMAREERGDEDALLPEDKVKACSVRELAGWIDENLRLNVTALPAEDLQMQFPELAGALAEEPEKVVSITHEHFLDDLRKGDEKTIVCTSWKRADGKAGSKECDLSVLGVVVVGRGRGQAFRVCTAKEKCRTHWGKEIRERQAREKERAAAAAAGTTSGNTSRSTASREAADRSSWEEQQRKREAERERWDKARPLVLVAVADVVKRLPLRGGLLEQVLVESAAGHYAVPAEAILIKAGKTVEDLVRHVAFLALHSELDQAWSIDDFHSRSKELGLDLKKLLAAADKSVPEPAPEKKPPAKGKKRS